ncbi:MAG: tyrosine-type recombinase/integrase, partial [Haloechinothrix sp.]
KLSAEASALRQRFPARPVPTRWPATCEDHQTVLARLLAPPFPLDRPAAQHQRRFGLIRLLEWLETQPGRSWQERWVASGAGIDGRTDWRRFPFEWLKRTGRINPSATTGYQTFGAALALLICGDLIRPDVAWLLRTHSPTHALAAEMARVRDPDGFATLNGLVQASGSGKGTTRGALVRIAYIMAAKGGLVRDITVGDCLELVEISIAEYPRYGRDGTGPYFYKLLHTMGVFPPQAPPTVRMFSPLYQGGQFQGQLTPEQLIDRYDLACRPVRDLLVDYLRERQPGIDFNTLTRLATNLGLLFWKDLENHHPGIASLRLAPDVATAWKQRMQTWTARAKSSDDGDVVRATLPRKDVASCLNAVRAFYLDIAQWATEDPARWAPWAVPCPIRADDIRSRKERSHRKSRMDQRNRERIPVLPALIAKVDRARKDAAELLEAARTTRPGEEFAAAGQALRRPVMTAPTPRIWAEDPDTTKRRDLTREEDHAFWAWAAVEVLRETGMRVEELTELSHHSLVEYKLPTTGETIPLLQIAPSKLDEERLLVVSPELAEVLSTILRRVRDDNGAVPLVVAYDGHERVWNPPMPLLFQHRVGMENMSFGTAAIRKLVSAALNGTGLTDAAGKPLTFVPHDFRRVFVTEAVMNGMPPHIAQLICGHHDINTTLGYKAIYPEEVINSHRAFIARRRALRPSEEYRTPTDEEWEEFLGHFERRKVALGDCGRAYATPCIHEHSCLRCPLLRPDPAQRPRVVEIHRNLGDRIVEAQRNAWAGEVEGLKVSRVAAEAKLAQIDGLAARRQASADHGVPGFPDVAGRTVTVPIASRPKERS